MKDYKFTYKLLIITHLSNFHDMEEKQPNKIIADGFLKLANKLYLYSNSEIEIKWRILFEQNGDVEQCLNVMKLCKPFLFNALLITTYVNDTVKIFTNLNSNVSTNVLTTDLTTHINQSNIHHDSQDIKWKESNNMITIIKNLNKNGKNPLERKKV